MQPWVSQGAVPDDVGDEDAETFPPDAAVLATGMNFVRAQLLFRAFRSAFDLEVSLEDSYFEHRLPEAVWHNWGYELRRDPRFKGWVRALGYDQHWRKYGWPDRCRPTGLNDFECV